MEISFRSSQWEKGSSQVVLDLKLLWQLWNIFFLKGVIEDK